MRLFSFHTFDILYLLHLLLILVWIFRTFPIRVAAPCSLKGGIRTLFINIYPCVVFIAEPFFLFVLSLNMTYSYIKYKSIVQIFYIYKNSETDKHTLLYTTLVKSKEKLQPLQILKDD